MFGLVLKNNKRPSTHSKQNGARTYSRKIADLPTAKPLSLKDDTTKNEDLSNRPEKQVQTTS
jgi:hypothetical protein